MALRRLQRICDNNFISVLDFKNNPLRIFAAHELAAIIDPAMTTKMTVQVMRYLSDVMEYYFTLTFISKSSTFSAELFSNSARKDITNNSLKGLIIFMILVVSD